MIQSMKTERKHIMSLDAIRTEPYRLLFPLGLATAAIGMGVWIPYFFLPASLPFPGQAHAVIQIQGFLLCFIFGFLATMLPKVLGVEPLGRAQFALFPAALIGITIASLAGAPRIAQVLHLLLLANFAVFVALRFPKRRSDPPPNFMFIAVAMLADVAGTGIKFAALSGWLGGPALRAGSLLQFQAFPMLLVLGVGGFLLPKLFANGIVDPQSLRNAPSKGIRIPALLSFLFLTSYGLEILGLAKGYGDTGLRCAYALRAAVWIWFIVMEIGIHKVKGKLPLYLFGARVSLIVMGAGLLMPVFRPAYLLAWEHVIFLSGFLRLTLSIASRVIAAHAGRLEILERNRKQTRVYGMLIVFAMFTRIATELWPRGHWMHMAVAASLAIAACAIWARIYFPLLMLSPNAK